MRSASAKRDAGTSVWDVAAREFEAWRAGDEGAVERLVRLMTPVLWQVVRACGLDREAAEDAVQATWLAVVRSADSVRDPQAISHWITTTARREASRTRRAAEPEDVAELHLIDAAMDPVPSPDSHVLANSSVRTIWRNVARLSPLCQRLLRMIAFAEPPAYGALSAELGLPLGSIGPNRGRCLQRLHRLLAADAEWSRS